MNKVWIVYEHNNHHITSIVIVCATEELAQAHTKLHCETICELTTYSGFEVKHG